MLNIVHEKKSGDITNIEVEIDNNKVHCGPKPLPVPLFLTLTQSDSQNITL